MAPESAQRLYSLNLRGRNICIAEGALHFDAIMKYIKCFPSSTFRHKHKYSRTWQRFYSDISRYDMYTESGIVKGALGKLTKLPVHSYGTLILCLFTILDYGREYFAIVGNFFNFYPPPLFFFGGGGGGQCHLSSPPNPMIIVRQSGYSIYPANRTCVLPQI